MATATGAIRKRQQIDRAGRMMFIWIAAASVIVGMAAVGAVFIGQKLFFNQKVIEEKRQTVSTLQDNISNIETLKQNIVALNSNSRLMGLVAKEGDRPLQVVLDAMPATGNTPALGASIKDKLTQGINGLKLESISIDPSAEELPATDDEEASSLNSDSSDSGERTLPGKVQPITFTLELSGNLTAFHELLQRFERSIRTINVTSFEFEGSEDPNAMKLRVRGEAYYQPTRTLDLVDKEVRP